MNTTERTTGREAVLIKAGYIIVGLPDDTWLCVWTADDEDGFSLIKDTREDCVNEAFDALINEFFEKNNKDSFIYIP